MNSQHDVFDVNCVADAIRRMALSILRRGTSLIDSVRAKWLRAGWDETVIDMAYDCSHAV
ncbi:hypothetical protein CGZ80_04655 [Rhodopirellula sp. MGV]|nr:hypothetical protein CGZ80_04655 [Rhodopirellula sp. MGV]PNY34928.1 hypothetical protein C2E31_20700 [Rhodopirellula baltica]